MRDVIPKQDGLYWLVTALPFRKFVLNYANVFVISHVIGNVLFLATARSPGAAPVSDCLCNRLLVFFDVTFLFGLDVVVIGPAVLTEAIVSDYFGASDIHSTFCPAAAGNFRKLCKNMLCCV